MSVLSPSRESQSSIVELADDSQETKQFDRVISLFPTPWWKRLVDVAISSCLIVAIAPLLIAIAIYIKCVSRGPALFIQRRVGYGGKYFQILKFRTMETRDPQATDDAHRRHVAAMAKSDGAVAKPDHGSRLILGGERLRSTSLDELPQLFNVLIGNMSLVGPRPDVLDVDDYEPGQLQRFGVLPGITGLWQVSGKNALSFRRMVELDVEYIERRSFGLDVWILANTARVVLAHDNE